MREDQAVPADGPIDHGTSIPVRLELEDVGTLVIANDCDDLFRATYADFSRAGEVGETARI